MHNDLIEKLKAKGKSFYPEKSMLDVIRDASYHYVNQVEDSDNLFNHTVEVITGVACKNEQGEILALPRPNRHHHIFALAAFSNLKFNPCLQGFMTDTGRFVTREEACNIVLNNNQAVVGQKHDLVKKSGQLFSEDVW